MKTAVELFIEQLEAQGESWENVSIGRIQISIKVEDYLKLIEQANKMFEYQIKNAWIDGVTNWDSEKEVEDYIKETFKSEI